MPAVWQYLFCQLLLQNAQSLGEPSLRLSPTKSKPSKYESLGIAQDVVSQQMPFN